MTEMPPLRILSQMAALQGLYYGAALVLMVFTSLVAGNTFSLDMVFGWSGVRGDTAQGWMLAFLWVLDGGLIVAVAMVVLVARSKLVLDFAVSLHAIHLAVVTLYSGRLPRSLSWWTCMAVSSVVAVTLGTWGCRRRELKPISFGGMLADDGNGEASAHGHHDGPSTYGDEEQALSRGRGRGKERGGIGEYEMGEFLLVNATPGRSPTSANMPPVDMNGDTGR